MSILLVPLMLMTTQIAYGAWEPPSPSQEKLVGPTIDAVLGLKNSTTSGYVALLLSGICNGTPFTRYVPTYVPGNVAGIETEDLIDMRLEIEGICNNNHHYELICISVKNFAKDGDMIIAEVVAVFVVPK